MLAFARLPMILLLLSGPPFSPPASGQAESAKAKPAIATTSSKPVSNAHAAVTRLLTADDGLAVIAAALESRSPRTDERDCSHLVHAIYERAGFSYRYASSAELYAGVEEFRRVWHPRAGDLVVWPGHAGVVVNPAQNAFYSALRSGRGIDSYAAPYWKARGRARFYRFIKTRPLDGAHSSAATLRQTRRPE